MKTSKLLELQALLKEYAAATHGTKRVMAISLAETVDLEARWQEQRSAQEESCERES